MNVADDHVDWHRSLTAYRLAKGRISRHLSDEDLLVYDIGDPGAVAHALGAPGGQAPVTGAEAGSGPEGPFGFAAGGLMLPGGMAPIRELPDLDYSFRVNLAASAVAAVELGADPAAAARVASRFRHRHHRRTVVGSLGDVTWVDDSKATNPHAAMAAIRSYPSVVLIAGGVRKGLDMSALVRAPNVRYMVAIGECGPRPGGDGRGSAHRPGRVDGGGGADGLRPSPGRRYRPALSGHHRIRHVHLLRAPGKRLHPARRRVPGPGPGRSGPEDRPHPRRRPNEQPPVVDRGPPRLGPPPGRDRSVPIQGGGVRAGIGRQPAGHRPGGHPVGIVSLRDHPGGGSPGGLQEAAASGWSSASARW